MKLAFIVAGLAFAGSAALAAPQHQEQAGAAQPMAMQHASHQHDAATAVVSKTLTVSGCWIRSLPEPAPSAGYFVVQNAGGSPAKLHSAASEAYGMVMLHQTTHEGGMSKMSMAHDIEIPANGTLEFKPGGYHAMLEKPSKPIVVGSFIPMDFLFSSGEKAVAQCEVKPANTLAH